MKLCELSFCRSVWCKALKTTKKYPKLCFKLLIKLITPLCLLFLHSHLGNSKNYLGNAIHEVPSSGSVLPYLIIFLLFMNFLFNKKLNFKKVNGNTEPDRYVSEITTITSMFLKTYFILIT